MNGSEYVAGPTARLGMIIMNGLEGNVHVNGQLYKFNSAMASYRNNFTDEEIAGIIDYLHNSFVSASPKLSYGLKSVSAEEIKNLRNKKSGTLTEEDLLKWMIRKNKSFTVPAPAYPAYIDPIQTALFCNFSR